MKEFFKRIVVFIITIEARLVLKKYKPKIIAVTGTVGKTGTKDALYTVLAPFLFVRKSEKSFNSELGIPLTVLGCPNAWNNPLLWIKNFLDGLSLLVNDRPYPKWLILEVGADHPGDIKRLMRWVKPEINVITQFADVPVHVEFFNSPEDVNAEDALLTRCLPESGFLILNADDERMGYLKERTKARVVTYGFNEGADIAGKDMTVLYEGGIPMGMTCRVIHLGTELEISVRGVLGKSPLYAILASLASVSALGLSLEKGVSYAKEYQAPAGRLKIISGIKGMTLIDDSYNSSPVALEIALETLRNIKIKGKKIALLGDMLELGRFSIEEHKRLGRLAGEICDKVVTVGIRACSIAEGALQAGLPESNIFQYEDSREAGKFTESLLGKGDVVLIKGSQGVRMERATKELMENPDQAGLLLPRQDIEWENR